MKIFGKCVCDDSVPNQICVPNKTYTQITGLQLWNPYAVKLFIDHINGRQIFCEETDDTLVYKFFQI